MSNSNVVKALFCFVVSFFTLSWFKDETGSTQSGIKVPLNVANPKSLPHHVMSNEGGHVPTYIVYHHYEEERLELQRPFTVALDDDPEMVLVSGMK